MVILSVAMLLPGPAGRWRPLFWSVRAHVYALSHDSRGENRPDNKNLTHGLDSLAASKTKRKNHHHHHHQASGPKPFLECPGWVVCVCLCPLPFSVWLRPPSPFRDSGFARHFGLPPRVTVLLPARWFMNPWARRATCRMRRSFLLASLIISLLLNSGWTDLILARARASLATSDSGVSDSPRPWWRRLRSRLQSPLCPRKLMHGDMLELWRHQEPQPQPLATLRVELLLDPWRAKWTFIPWTKDGEGSLATFHTKVPLQQACNLVPAAARTSPPQPWWKLIFPRTPRRVIHLRSPERTNTTWILTPWTI